MSGRDRTPTPVVLHGSGLAVEHKDMVVPKSGRQDWLWIEFSTVGSDVKMLWSCLPEQLVAL